MPTPMHAGISERRAEATTAIVEQFSSAGIDMIASLPDDWVSYLIDVIDEDGRFRHVPVNREESAIGLCSGAYFGGVPSMALMGASGLLTVIYAITKINYTYHIPLFLTATLRGAIGDPHGRHISNGLYLEPLLQSISLPYVVIESRDQLDRIPEAFHHSRIINRPTVALLGGRLLSGEA